MTFRYKEEFYVDFPRARARILVNLFFNNDYFELKVKFYCFYIKTSNLK